MMAFFLFYFRSYFRIFSSNSNNDFTSLLQRYKNDTLKFEQRLSFTMKYVRGNYISDEEIENYNKREIYDSSDINTILDKTELEIIYDLCNFCKKIHATIYENIIAKKLKKKQKEKQLNTACLFLCALLNMLNDQYLKKKSRYITLYNLYLLEMKKEMSNDFYGCKFKLEDSLFTVFNSLILSGEVKELISSYILDRLLDIFVCCHNALYKIKHS